MYQQEKVYLHFDNTGYFLGESIWFKAYISTANDLAATSISRVLYVELLDLEGNILNTQKLCITNGQADGTIPLTRLDMKSGFYEVRAYTRVMLNWDEGCLFSRVFPVFETPNITGDYDEKKINLRLTSYQIPQKRAKAPSAKKLNVAFYPEGGQLVKGLTSTVAFKVTDKEGRAQEATGCICNAQGDTISRFATLHEGMGSFSYTPTDSTQIWIRSSDAQKSTAFELPRAELSGCVMQVQKLLPQQLEVKISGTSEYDSVPLGLTVMCRGKVSLFKLIQSIPKAGCYIVIPKTKLPTGVNQLTLFTSEGKILAERLVCIPGVVPSLKMEVRPDKSLYKKFEQINMNVSVQNETGNPVETTLSLAVRDSKAEIPSAYQENIQTNLLLSSDLKGYISNPEYYFESDDKTHHMALDLLMLTQGYRRYSWSQMAGITPFQPIHKIETDIVVRGCVKSIIKKKIRENIDVTMSIFSDSTYQQSSCTTDSTGSFSCRALDFYGKWNLHLETKKKNKRSEYWITLDRLFTPQGRPYSFYDTYIPEMKVSKDKKRFLLDPKRDSLDTETLLNDSLDFTKGTTTLKEVVVKGKRNRDEFLSKGVNILYDAEEEENKLEDKASAYNENICEFLARINPFFSYDDICSNPRYKGRKVYFTFSNEISNYNNVDKSQSESTSSTNSAENSTGVNSTESTTEGNSTENDQRSSEKKQMEEWKTEEVEDRKKEDTQDELRQQNIEIQTLSSSDIQSIAIIEDPNACVRILPAIASQAGTFVVIAITRSSNRLKKDEPIGVRLTTLQGFSEPRTFYSPNYKEYQLPKGDDFRRTLYWNPNVKTNSQGKASVSFFNNGTCKEMTISAETITSKGIFGSYENSISH